MPLPHADPAPWPGQICSQSGRSANRCRLRYSVRALASIVPAIVRGALEQIGPADVADEHEVAGRRRDRLVRRGAVGHEKRQMLRRVPRRVHHVDADVADRDCDRRPSAASRPARGEGVLPGRVALVRDVHRRARARRQLAGAGHEVRVDVRLGDVRDPRPFGLAAARRYCSASRFGSMTMASRVAAQPIR